MNLSLFTRCYHFKKIDSTSTYLKSRYKNLKDMTFVSCDYQTAGRGRNSRAWISDSGANLLFSLLIKDSNLIKRFDTLSILSALTIKESLDNLGLKDVTIKRPNDVYLNGKKVCGILLDGVTENNALGAVIIGIGINVNQMDYPIDLLRSPTSIAIELGHKIDLKAFKKDVYKRLKYNLKHIDKTNYLERVRAANYLKNKEVYAELNNEKQLIKVLDINDDNSLLISVADKTLSIKSGEITFHVDD